MGDMINVSPFIFSLRPEFRAMKEGVYNMVNVVLLVVFLGVGYLIVRQNKVIRKKIEEIFGDW